MKIIKLIFAILSLIIFLIVMILGISGYDSNFFKAKYEIIKLQQDTLSSKTKATTTLYNVSEYEAEVYVMFANRCKGNWCDYIAMIRTESNFKTGLMSSKGARGLTQVMPMTMKNMCNKMNIPYDESTAWNDIINVVIGFKYLEDAIKLDSTNRFKIYVGGPEWKRSSNQEYINQYDKMMKKESKILELIYKGLK